MIGVGPADIAFFDFTQPEESMRNMLFGRDDWVIPAEEHGAPIHVDGGNARDYSEIDALGCPYLDSIHPDLHCALLNWLGRRIGDHNAHFEALLDEGLRNIMAHGSSHLRRMASDTLLKLQCLDRFHAGDAGICRIVLGQVIQLDDCASQDLAIGNLHFQAIDYGYAISLNHIMQQRLCVVDKDEKNQFTLLAAAAGVVARDMSTKDLPTRSRVARTAHALRIQEWSIAHPLTSDHGDAKSINERTVLILCRDITQPNHDRDYRSLGVSRATFLAERSLAISVFDILNSGSGETALQVNILGDLNSGEKNGYIDILAHNGHTRWLKRGLETLPACWANWLRNLADFVYTFPFLDACEVLDLDRDCVAQSPWLSCRQCRRKERRLHWLHTNFTNLESIRSNGRMLSYSRISIQVGTQRERVG